MANKNSFGRFSCKRVRDNLATKQQQQGGLKKRVGLHPISVVSALVGLS